ncbi:hypothetical protein HNQ02_001430 [Flavobacterium sp. 7E]|uniref:hypothetical protein n=1 Tax=Flavobacterium sp. 7E TaxID=2735898 RepID=UPI00156DAE7D|nr:hypothetical protein [Flavobacterium sp. 7E]NRS88516.1 hypothetical protein [Flavobacterium sp. 7E]
MYDQFERLLIELKNKPLSNKEIITINENVDAINTSTLEGNDFAKLIKTNQIQILKLIQKESKIVPQQYYMTLGTITGMTAIGLPVGVAFGYALGNMGLLGLGLPIGLALGAIIGKSLDKKAFENNKQLGLAIKY